ncbi:MAG: hypothetical protein IJ594_10070 [Oscillospiraceae bacterium]|nr:hypothetical protein [Oscillospiraceae bacterium]
MTQTYFLGANSKDGFASVYADFPPDESVFLHVVKGGPGTGKSSLMRRIGRAAEEKGLDVHYVLCSGDPDSLDGVYVPALGAAWMDGTAPHVTEPAAFGVSGDYVNLSCFCRLPFSAADREHALSISRTYKALYAQAYAWLSAAAAAETAAAPAVPVEPAAEEEILALVREACGAAEPCVQRPRRRFLRALSCRGELRLNSEIQKLCKHIVQVGDPALLSRAAARCPAGAILCPSPLHPERPEAILLPEASLALVDSGWRIPVSRSLAPAAPPTAEQAEAAAMRERMLVFAFDRLRRAKALHDELEAVCRRYMDFDALTAFTDRLLAGLFA